MSVFSFLRVPLVAVCIHATAACRPVTPPPTMPMRELREWTAEEAELFDDGVDLEAVTGTPVTAGGEAVETRATSRALKADGVVIGKVIGVSSEPAGEKQRYRLELTVEGDPLAGAKLDSPFTLKVEPGAPAYGTVRSRENQLIGKKFVVFFRQYAADDGGESITHFHLSAAEPKIFQAIERANTRKKVVGRGSAVWTASGRRCTATRPFVGALRVDTRS